MSDPKVRGAKTKAEFNAAKHAEAERRRREEKDQRERQKQAAFERRKGLHPPYGGM